MPKHAALCLAALALLCTSGAAAAPLGLHATRPSHTSTAGAVVASSRILLGGRPFFPLMALGQCTPATVARAAGVGIDVFMSADCPQTPVRRQLALASSHGLAVLPVASQTVRGPKLAGWTFPDEPENNHWTPRGLAQAHPYRRGSADGLLSFMTTGAGFFGARAPSTPPDSTYRDFARLADVAGFDLYPLGHCSRDLVSVYDAQRKFVALAGRMPTFQWIETGPIKPEYCGGFRMQPEELRAEVWLAVAGGARGIGYFTHTWSPRHRTFDVRPALVPELRRTNRQLRALTPALLGQGVLTGSDSGAIKLIARRAGNRVYVFAVNSTRGPIKVQLHVPALGSGRVRAIEENRTLPVVKGRVVDRFAPLAVHLYVSS